MFNMLIYFKRVAFRVNSQYIKTISSVNCTVHCWCTVQAVQLHCWCCTVYTVRHYIVVQLNNLWEHLFAILSSTKEAIFKIHQFSDFFRFVEKKVNKIY